MSMLGIDGFDNYNSTVDMLSSKATSTRAFQWTAVDDSFIQAGTNFFNYGKCIQLGYGGPVATLTNHIETGIWGGHCHIPLGASMVIRLYDSSAWPFSSQCCLFLNSDNARITARRTSSYYIMAPVDTDFAATSNNVFPVNSTFFLEVSCTIGTSSGALVISVNGVTVLNLTGQNTKYTANAYFDQWGWIGGPCQIDNFYFLDTAVQSSGTNPFNIFQGSFGLPRVFTSFPVGNSGSEQFAPHPGTNTNAQNVEETAMDGDTTYNSASTPADQDLFTITPLPTGLTPLYCQVKAAARQTSAGSLSLATVLKSSTTTHVGDTLISYQTYTYQGDGTPVDPATGNAWINADVSAALIGYKEIA